MTAAAGLLLTALTALVARAAGDGPLVLEHARVLDAAGEHWLDDQAVVVRDGRIAEILAAQELAVRAESPELAGATTLDLDGRALIPGLIDLHTHLLLHPYSETPWDEQVLREPLELRTIRATVQARATLAAGFTTIRDLGTEGAGFADVALRDAIRAGTIAGPRLVVVTRALVLTGRYDKEGKGAQEVSGVDAMRAAVREQIAAGADWIKVYADYPPRRGEAATPTFSLEELQAAVSEAKSSSRKVAAHATSDEGIRRAVQAGVATIEHGDGASDATLASMKETGAVLVPTLAAVETIADRARLERALAVVRRAQAAGVTIACGSDAGVFAHGANAREIELLVQAGLSPAAALRAATVGAADVLGRGDLGRLAPGAVADLVALDGDPLADPGALRRVALVLQEGKVAIDRRGDATLRGSAAEQDAAIAFCRRFLAAYSGADFDAVARAFAPDATVANAGLDEAGRGDAKAVAAATFVANAKESRPKQGPLHETITGVPIALVDGPIATVWAPFRVEFTGGAGHGIDVFQLARIGGEWKIIALAWTFRRGAS